MEREMKELARAGRRRGTPRSPGNPGSILRPGFVAVTLALAALPVSALAGADWPQWLGPRRDGISREGGWRKDWPAGGPPRLWTKEIGTGYSGIVVASGRLILFHRLGGELAVDSLDARTGERGWRFTYPTDYVDRYGYDNGPRCAPIVRDGRVYTLGPKGILHALDAGSGREVWKRDLRTEHGLEPNFFGTGATPILEGGVIYAHLGGTRIERGSGYALAYDASGGDLRWKTPTEGGSYASPVIATIDGARHLFIFHRGGLSSLDPEDGEERWRYPWHSRVYESVNAATPVVDGDLVFFSATYGTGSVCLRAREDDYEVVWKDDLSSRDKVLEIHWAPPLLLEGHVYGFSGRHANGSTLRCVELSTGELRWSWRSYLYRGSMLHSDGHFIAMGEFGDLALLRLSPEGHEEVARVRRILEYPAWTVPTLSGGLLYLRDTEKLICLDLRGRKEEVTTEDTEEEGEGGRKQEGGPRDRFEARNLRRVKEEEKIGKHREHRGHREEKTGRSPDALSPSGTGRIGDGDGDGKNRGTGTGTGTKPSVVPLCDLCDPLCGLCGSGFSCFRGAQGASAARSSPSRK